uniref:F-box domain-containing protein n=1 Tax=Leersia perrieri TaxID=77586 RepID=A0A0D9W5B6_9ORYZ
MWVYSMCLKYELPHLGSSTCRLKRLCLSSVTLGSCFAEQLRTGCPLRCCRIEFCNIQSGTLKNLVMYVCSSRTFDGLVIRTPRLASLRLLIKIRNGVSLHEVNSLMQASIDVSNCQISPRGEAMLPGGLFSVTNLELRDTAILDKQFDKIPVFSNLKTLLLYHSLQDKGTLSDKLKVIGRLLQKSPNLEKLTLQGCRFLEGSETEKAKQKTSTFMCLKSQDQVSFQCEKLKLIEMAPVSKRVCTGEGGGSTGDRLSSLPDGLLHAILSSLTTKQAVQMGVLSKRWTDLWRSVPRLCLDNGDFLGEGKEKWGRCGTATTSTMAAAAAPPSKCARVVIAGSSDDIDRLSDMPEEILHAIISFLPANQAVQTCVLSSRWRDLWTTMPNIDIDQHNLAAGGGKLHQQFDKLESFAYPFLLSHRGGTIERLRVSVTNPGRGGDADLRHVTRWVHGGVRRFPATVEVNVPPPSAWLRRRLDIGLPACSTGECYYRRLRRLSLAGVSLDGRFAALVRRRFTALEELELRGCDTGFEEIASATLARLVVHGCGAGAGGGGKMVVTAPRLASLHVLLPRGNCAGLVVNEAARLVAASVSLRPSATTRAQRRAVACLFNVTSLFLLNRADGETDTDIQDFIPDPHDFNTSWCPNLKVTEIKGDLHLARGGGGDAGGSLSLTRDGDAAKRMEEMPPEPVPKRSRAGTAIASDDHLSALPDGVLHVILSFLPALEMVRTTVLSRRWRDLWCYTPYINIDQRELGIQVRYNLRPPEEKWAKFENFTTNMLLFHCNTVFLDKFRLYAQSQHSRDVEKWIRRGIKYSPRVLKILTPGYDRLPLQLPHLGSSVRRLKSLHLFNVTLDDQFAEMLISDRSVLEKLKLETCSIYFQNIVSSTLKKLALESCVHYTSHPTVISAPCLESLDLHIQHICYRNGISLCEMASLVEVSINIEGMEYFTEENQCSLLVSLVNVTTLELSGFNTTAFLGENPNQFPKYPCMRTLSLGFCFLDEYDLGDKLEALGSFLENALCLEKLTLICCMFNGNPDTEWDTERKIINLHQYDMKTFKCPKLKLVEFCYEDDTNHRLTELVWCLGRMLPNTSIKIIRY